MQYDTGAKAARMNALRALVAGGTLEVGTANMGSVLASFKLADSGGSVRDTTWHIAFADDNATARNEGRASVAQIKDASGTVRISKLRVGMGAGDFDVVISNTQVNNRQTVSLEGEQSITHA